MYYQGSTIEQHKTPPHPIKKQGFIPNCMRKDNRLVEFRSLVIGALFRFGPESKVEAYEKLMILRKTGPSNIERNAQVVMTKSPYHNPVNQIWTIDANVDVIPATL